MVLTPHTFEKYRWCTSDNDPAVSTRYAAGCERFEDFLNRYVHGQQNLFLGVSTTLAHPAQTADVLRAARQAWCALRASIPVIASSTTQDADDETLITYRTASVLAFVEAWAERTVTIWEGSDNLDAARTEIGKSVIPDENGEQTFIYIVPRSLTEYGFLLFTHHTPFDSAGARIVMSRFLALLSRYLWDSALATRELKDIDWGADTARLLPAYPQAIAETESINGAQYEQALADMTHGIRSNLPLMHGYKLRNVGRGHGITFRMQHRFTVQETKKIIQYAQAKGLTVDHLVQAAVYLSALYNNPEVKDGSLFASFAVTNARARLAAPYNSRHGYPGYCLQVSPIAIPLSQVQGTDQETQLLSVARAVQVEYARQHAREALLPIFTHAGDLLVASLKSEPHSPWTGPWYADDGVGENYLDTVYTNQGGGEILRVTDFFTSLKQTEPGPYFRSYTWADCLTISADYNVIVISRDTCGSIMRSIIQSLSVSL